MDGSVITAAGAAIAAVIGAIFAGKAKKSSDGNSYKLENGIKASLERIETNQFRLEESQKRQEEKIDAVGSRLDDHLGYHGWTIRS